MLFPAGWPSQSALIASTTTLTGLTFSEAWPGRVQASFGAITVDVIGREAFIRNKRATGRARDLGDLEALGE